MIVVDASAVLELLLGTAQGRRVASRLAEADDTLHAPSLVDVEVLQVLRRLTRARALGPDEAESALADLEALDSSSVTTICPCSAARGTFAANVSAYDAVYVALAEALDAPLLTCDTKLTRAPGLDARILHVS